MVQDCINGMSSDGGNSALLNMNNSDILSFLQQQTQSSDGFSLNLDGQRSAVGSSQFPSSFLNNRGAPTNMLMSGGLNLQQLANDLEGKRSSSQNMTECVPVPSSEHVAEIVGRQGCKIKALRAKTNTYIKTPVRGDEPIFVVTGRREDVANAKREILSAADHFSQIRACRRSNLNGSMAPGPPANLPGHVTEYVEVPYKVVGLVVGPKGATIKKIQQSTNTYIVTPSRDREPKFEISGLPENVTKAKKLIQEHIAERTGFSSDNMPVSFEALNRFASANNLTSGNLGQNLMGDQTQSLNTMLSNNNPALGAIARNQFNSPNSYLNSLNNIPSNFSASDFAMAGFPGFGTLENNLTPSVPLNNLGGISTSSLTSNSASIANNILAQPFGSSLADSVSSFGLGSRSTRPSSEEWEAFRNPSFGGNYSSLGRIGSRSSDEGIGSSSNSSPALNDAVQNNPWNSVLSSNPLGGGSNRQSPDLRSDAFDPIREVTQSMGSFGFQQAQSEVFTSTKDMLLQSTNALLASAASTSTPSEESLFSFSAGASDTTSLSPLSRQSPTNSKVKRCHYCTSTKVNAFFVPCGHNVTCGECAFKLEKESRQCPLCHQTVTQVVGHLGDESTR